MYYLYAAAGIAGLVLQVLLVGTMFRRNAYREFPFLFTYTVVLLVTSSVEARAFFSSAGPGAASSYYWIADALRQTLLYLVVIALTDRAAQRTARGLGFRRILAAGSLAYIAVSLYFTYHHVFMRWMTNFSRNLGFLAVLLNLVLWAVLLVSRQRSQTILLVSTGIGLQMTGKAAGHSFRVLSDRLVPAGNLMIVLTHLACLYIWWHAFRAWTGPKTAAGR